MARSKLACLSILCLMLLLPGLVTGQVASYKLSHSSPTVSDGTTNCAVGKTPGCWKPISTSPALTSISSGIDGTPYALDASGNLWTLPFRSHIWQSSALSPMAEISVNSAQDIYGLQFDSGYCLAPEMRIFRFTGGVDFAKLSYCALHIATATDGTVYRIRSSGSVNHLVSGSWIQDTSAGGNGTPIKISAGTAKNVWLVTSTGVIKTLNSSGVFVVVPGYATDVATAGNPGKAVTWIVGTTANANNVYTYNYGSNTWTPMIGVLKKISTGGTNYTMGLGSAGGIWHFNATVLSVRFDMQGYYDCGSAGCPPGSFHTASVTMKWGSGGHSTSASSSGSPSSYLDGYGNATTQNCDPIFGDPTDDPECEVEGTGTVLCAAMGAIAAGGSSVGFGDLIGFAQTLVAVAGPAANCTTSLGVTTCTWPVVPNCINTPVYIPLTVEDSPPALKGWWSDGTCVRASINDQWHCGPIPFAALKTTQTQPGQCRNPE